MGDNYDISTLNWVKGEIDETLKQARLAVDAFVENPEDPAQLQFCAAFLHQVVGTLRLVELKGAAEVTAEMERLALALLDNPTASNRDDMLGALTQAILQVPDYLESLQAGQPDTPLVLLPLINELRAARGQKPVGEEALFWPDLTVVPPGMPKVAPNPTSLFQKARLYYQAALLKLMQGKDVDSSLKALSTVLDKVLTILSRLEVRQWIWVSGGLIEALQDGGLALDTQAKQLLGRIDQMLKRLIEQGEAGLERDALHELVRALLFRVARSASRGRRVGELRSAFLLAELLPSSDDLSQRRDRLRGMNAALKQAVGKDITEELARVKDVLDLFARSEQRPTQELVDVADGLAHVANTLDLLEREDLSQALREQSQAVRNVVAGEASPGESLQMGVAAAIIAVETAMQGWGSVDRIEQADDAEDTGQGDHRQVVRLVMREAKEDLIGVKEALTKFLLQSDDRRPLEEGLDRLHRIAGSLALLSYRRVARVVTACERFIHNEMRIGAALPQVELLDDLADALTAVEYYLEAFIENRVHPGRVLDVAEASLARLGYPVDALPERAAADPGCEPQRPSSKPEEEEAAEIEPVGALEGEGEVPILAEPVSEEETGIGEIEAVPQVEAAAPPVAPKVAEAAPAQEADEEIRAIFVEEAEEELNNIEQFLAAWRSDVGNTATLKDLRRSFHTIKGSGRLVGAMAIGEFAWAFEDLLNRVIDQRVQPGPDLFSLLDRAMPALQELVEAFKGGPAPRLDTASIEAFAHLLASGEALPETDTFGQEPAEIDAQGETAPLESPDIDPVLLEIYSNEVDTHLQRIESFLRSCAEGVEPCRVNDGVVRALHTLHGSSLTARMEPVADVARWLEKIGKLLQGAHAVVGEETRTLLADAALGVRSWMEGIKSGNKEAAPLGDLAVQAKAQFERLEAHHEQPDAPLPSVALSGPEQQEQEEAVAESAPAYAEDEADQLRLLESLLEEEPESNDLLAQGQVPEPPQTVPAEPPPAVQATEVDDELLAAFLEEGTELLDAGEELLHSWAREPENAGFVAELQRNLHTFKGSARMAGIGPIGDLTHSLETALDRLVDGRIPVSRLMINIFQLSHDRLMVMLELARKGKPVPDADDLIADVERITRGEAPAQRDSGESGEPPVSAVAGAEARLRPTEASRGAPLEPTDGEDEGQAAGEDRRRASRVQYETVRVRADLLDDVVDFAGEVSIYRSRIEQQLGGFGFNIAEMARTVERLREQLRQFEIQTEQQIQSRSEETSSSYEQFDPLEFDRFTQMQQISRSMMETLNDLTSIENMLHDATREAETLLLQQGRVNTELQETLTRTRMVPLVESAPRLRRVVRQTCAELGKQAELRFRGAEFEIDRNLVDRILPVLEHILRNAVAHGIESPDERRAHEKSELGTITVGMAREGSESVIRIDDDGRGIDVDAVRKKALERGLITPETEMTDQELVPLILESGLSTAQSLTQIAGRGVGMDAVSSEIKQLGGSLEIESKRGHGTRFTIRLPLNLSVTRALMVQLNEELYAVPLLGIQGLVRVSAEEYRSLLEGKTDHYNWLEQDYQFLHLGQVLGTGVNANPAAQKYPLLFTRSAGLRVALAVDGLLGSREVVVKSLGPQLSTLPELAGATILGDGRVVLILDLPNLLRKALARSPTEAIPPESSPLPSEHNVPVVLVVDDSITVRRVTARLLENNNMKAITARDGLEAVALLEEVIPDVVLLDIEMPRMDGYELATHIRNSERLKHMPIIMITSRTGDKHRQRAMDIGVDVYQGKPYQENELLDNVRAMIARKIA